MLPEEVTKLVEAIARDNRSGAFTLALRALDAFMALEATNEEKADELLSELLAAQPWMQAVVNASYLGWSLARLSRWRQLSGLKVRLKDARRDVAQQAARVLRGFDTLLTISYSSDVYEALRLLHEEDHRPYVIVMESRPLVEGVRLVEDLQSLGLKTAVIVDAAGPTLVREVDAVVSGVDSLLRSGDLVNKIGTLPLALACKEFRVPFYPLMEVLKVELEEGLKPWVPETRDPTEVHPKLDSINIYFEKLPTRLVNSLITDAGMLEPAVVLERFRNLGDLSAFYGARVQTDLS